MADVTLLADLLTQKVTFDALSSTQRTLAFRAAHTHGVYLPLYALYKQAAHNDLVPATEIGRYRPHALRLMAQTGRYLVLSAQVNAAFRQAGIEAVWLKGVALAHTVYPMPDQRTMRDIDVLVPKAHCEQALEVLARLGFHPDETLLPARLPATMRAGVSHHHHLMYQADHTIRLELHYDLVKPRLGATSSQNMAFIWENTHEIPTEAGRLRVMCPDMLLAYLGFHTGGNHADDPIRLQWLLDIHYVVATCTTDWANIQQIAERLGWMSAMQRAFGLTNTYLRTPIPAQLLPGDSARDAPQRLAEGYIRWLWRVPWRSRMALLKALLIPPKASIRRAYDLEEDAPFLFVHYLKRLVHKSRLFLNNGR